MNTEWRPRKPRLHNPRCVREPKAPLRNGALLHVATKLLERLKGPKKQLPPSLKAVIDHSPEHRELRCDGLESIWVVIYCLLAFMSIKSLRVGYRQRAARRRGWKSYDLVGVAIKQICGWTGLDDSTVSHVLSVLREAGWLQGPSKNKDGPNHINQPWETLADGRRAPLPAIRRFTFVMFAELGLAPMLTRARTQPAKPEAAPDPNSRATTLRALADAHTLHDSS